MSAPSPAWYLRRLRSMGPTEVAGRAADTARRALWARRQVRPGRPGDGPGQAGVPADLVADRYPPAGRSTALPSGARAGVDPTAAAALVAAADAVLAGTWTVLGTVRADSADPDWFADPVTGRRAPQDTLCFRVQHRDEDAVGNVKQLWELSRHHHLTVLAAAHWLTGEERYAQACADQLTSWWRANPFLSGIHWTSGIEVGIRLISWVWVRRLLADWPKVGDLFEDNPDAHRQVAWHHEFLAAFPSRGSSANNHLIAEAAGHLAAACALPWYARSEAWRRQGATRLERALAENTFPSGVNREQATEYHGFVADLALLAAVEADAAGHPLSEGTWQRIAAMLDVAAAVVDASGRPPRQGDGDDGRALLLDAPPHHRDAPEAVVWNLTLDAGRAVLGAPGWWPATAPTVRGAALGALAGTPPEGSPGPSARALTRLERPTRYLPDAGLVLLRSRPEDGPEIWCRADAGPHGFGRIAGHAHADALAVEVRHAGTDVLADPGTYCYHGEAAWRDHFRSTAAHNTLEIAGTDSSTSGGPFLWTRHARTTTTRAEVGDLPVQTWTGHHDGYTHLPVPATHHRGLTLDSPGRTLTVLDTVRAAGPVPVRLTWQLGPRVEATVQNGPDGVLARLRWPGAAGRLALPEDLTWAVRRGTADPIDGWYSSAFGEREPATVLVGTGTVRPTTVLTTTLVIDDDRGEQR